MQNCGSNTYFVLVIIKNLLLNSYRGFYPLQKSVTEQTNESTSNTFGIQKRQVLTLKKSIAEQGIEPSNVDKQSNENEDDFLI